MQKVVDALAFLISRDLKYSPFHFSAVCPLDWGGSLNARGKDTAVGGLSGGPTTKGSVEQEDSHLSTACKPSREVRPSFATEHDHEGTSRVRPAPRSPTSKPMQGHGVAFLCVYKSFSVLYSVIYRVA